MTEPSPPIVEAKPPPADPAPARKRGPVRTALYWIGGVLGTLIAAVVIFLLVADWNWLRGPISRYASAKMHREVVIAGDLDVKPWSWSPTATARNIRIGDAKWADKGNMAELETLTVSIRILPLLKGDIDLPLLRVDKPNVRLVRDRQGRANWDFSDGRKTGKPLKLPPIRRFIIDDGQLTYIDRKRGLSFDGSINATEKLGARGHGFELAGRGALNGAPFLMQVTGGPLLNIERDKPYPFDADIRAGATRVTARGAVSKPFDLGQLHMNISAQGPDLADLYNLTGVALPNTPPYRLSGRLVRDEAVFRLNQIGGRVGDSDLAGGLSVDTGKDRPLLTADLRSRSLDFDDLAAVFGGAPSTKPGETVSEGQKIMARQMAANQRLLPDATLKVDRIRSMDADVRYKAVSVRDAPVPLSAASLRVKLNGGVLRADPLELTLAQGKLSGWVELDARLAVPVTDLDVRLTGARLEQLIPIRGGEQPLTGPVVARVKLTGQGASVHRAAADADGEALVVIPNGEIRRAFAELIGINVTKGLGLLLSKNPEKTEIRCAVAHFQARDGVLTANRIVFDTGPVLGVGSGSVDLEAERIDFRLEGKPKEVRLIRLLAPITVKGPIRSPKVGIEAGKAVAQGGFAALVGSLISPLAAILPFIDPGLEKDAACGTLIAEAGRASAPARPPVR